MCKYGRQSGLQRYRCSDCSLCFQSAPKARLARNQTLWQEYVFNRKTFKVLNQETGLSHSQLRRIVHATPETKVAALKSIVQTVTLVIDTTYFDDFGVMVFRAWPERENLLWYFVGEESNVVYLLGLSELQRRGYKIRAVVCDGKKWLPESISSSGIPVQLCQFHLLKTVTKHLTKYPILPAGRELRHISLQLKYSTESEFKAALDAWLKDWSEFLKEKTIDPETGAWQYTHRRIRSAYKSILSALPFLFTYQKFPQGLVPNTTNTLDGSFSQLKQKIHVHRGLNKQTQMKMVSTLLAAPAKKPTKKEH